MLDGVGNPVNQIREVRRMRVLRAATIVVVVFALGGCGRGQTTDVVSPRDTTSAASDLIVDYTGQPVPDGMLAVEDRQGRVRGYIPEDFQQTHANGESDLAASPVQAVAVLATDGSVLGYFLAGNTGFVDSKVGNDPLMLDLLVKCMAAVGAFENFDTSCDVVLASQGVDPAQARALAGSERPATSLLPPETYPPTDS
ncbi:MAG: hypothetical protein F2828_14105 [Actinobacteria bacterium]|nr:hypothetical protein [Actinomycetota bacterium]